MQERPNQPEIAVARDSNDQTTHPPAKRNYLRALAVALAIGHLLAVIALAGAAVYRTPGTATALLNLLAAAAALLAAAVSTLFLWILRSRWGQRAIWASLTDLAQTDQPEELLAQLQPVTVGPRMSPAAKGWNRLLAAVDALREDLPHAPGKMDLGGFLCSYDAQRLLGVLDALGDGVMLADATGQVVLANRACEGKLGRQLGALIGRPLLDIFDSQPARDTLANFLDHPGSGADCTFQLVIHPAADATSAKTPAAKPPDPAEAAQRGATILRVWCHRLGDGGENCDLLLDLRDVTQQKLSEASRDAFIASVSHELRSPLTNIRAYAETLLSDMILDAKAQKEAFNVINEETERLLRLVNDILDLSRMETGSMTLDRGEVVLDRLIRQCIQDVRALAAAKQITLETNFHPKLPSLCADRAKLAVVFNNILTNAIKYTPENGTVFVETAADDRYVSFKVTDTGYGIAPEDLERIFEKFYRVHREETANIEGSGLGLAICREIVSLHRGHLHATSEIDKGTEMIVKLPLTQVGPVLGPALAADAARGATV